MAEAAQPGSPEAWLKTLSDRLDARRRELKLYDDYFNGDHPMAFATARFRQAFGALFSSFADNWCKVIVDSSVERLKVQGFRFGGEGKDGDRDAWEIWQRNNLDSGSRQAHTEAVKLGTAYLLVDRDDDGKALITTEHPFQMIVAHAPGNRRRRLAALKKWVDDESGRVYATVYLPEGAYKFQSTRLMKDLASGGSVEWEPRAGVPAFVTSATPSIIPTIPLENNPSMLTGGRSDLEDVPPLQNAINKLANDMIVTSESRGFRQRWATGIEIPTDPETGLPLERERWLSDHARVWTVGDSAAKFGEFDAADLQNYVTGIDLLVKHLGAQTRTPPHYLLGEIVNASGDALKAAESGLSSKCWGKIADFKDPHVDAMRLAFMVEGNSKAGVASAVSVWANPEVRSDAEKMDAAIKMRALGLSYERCWEFIGLSPEEIAEEKRLTGLPAKPAPGATQPPPPAAPFVAANGSSTSQP